MKAFLQFFAPILFAAAAGCGPPPVSQQTPASNADRAASPEGAALPVRSPIQKEPSPEGIGSIFVPDDALTYEDYALEKLSKKVQIENTEGPTEVSYAVLKRKGKIVAKFDGLYGGSGNATDFGLFSFLRNTEKQLVVSQTVPRDGRYWIVSLNPDFRLIYDSGDYGIGHEELNILDIDKDGVYEVLQFDPGFYGLAGLSPAETPLPLVIFKYDPKDGKYLPANHLFKAYALKDIDGKIADSRSKLLDITLQYIYAGEEPTAWKFFEKKYMEPDKDDMRSKIKFLLANRPVYKFISAETRIK